MLPNYSPSQRIYFLPLNHDQGQKETREMYVRYRQIAQAYSLPKMDIVYHNFTTLEDQQSWLENKKNIMFSVSGDEQSLKLTFNLFKRLFTMNQQPLPEWIDREVKKLDLVSGKDFQLLQIKNSPQYVAVALLPNEITIPLEPKDLNLHYLAWLGRSLSDFTIGKYIAVDRKGKLASSHELDMAEQEAFYRDSLSQLVNYNGTWKSPMTYLLGRHVLATYDLIKYVFEPRKNEKLLEEIFNYNRSNLKLLAREGEKDLSGLARVNLGIARVVSAEDQSDYDSGIRELKIAFMQEKVTKSSKLAMLNLILLNTMKDE
ncbi:MAG: hypothetical protein KBC84_08355 [Proteobacteria bacterium]|nr:hypothetical protein [Pseudomonadota bacterium]